jgi:hypothetical protein
MSRASTLQTVQLNQVILNVYDLDVERNQFLYQFGLGMYHSGVEIGGNEWTFASGGGIYSHEPRGAGGATFREAITLGKYGGTQRDLDRILDELRESFKGSSYHVLTQNCNCFADALVQRLLNKPIPGFVNRLASIGAFFSCLLPPAISNDAPVNQDRVGLLTAQNQPFSGQGMRLSSNTVTEGQQEVADAKDVREKVRAAALARFNQN